MIKPTLARLALACCALSMAHAGVIYSNLGTPAQFDGVNGWEVDGGVDGGQMIAAQFISITTAPLIGVRLALGISFTNLANSPIEVYIASDSAGLPGAVFANLSAVTGETPGSFPTGNFVDFVCTGCPLLIAGTSYWVVAGIPNADLDHFETQAEWNWNTTLDYSSGINFAFNDTQFGGGWQLGSNDVLRPAFSVDAVPEPATVVLLGLGLLMIARIDRR